MSYSRAMGFVNMRLSLAILRASVHCLRGAWRKFFSLSNDSGAANRPTFLDCLLSVLIFFCRSLFSSLNAWLADLLIVSSYYSFSVFRTASFFRLSTWNWFVRTNFRTFEGLRRKWLSDSTSASISEKVNISWDQRSVDAIFTCVDLHDNWHCTSE